MGGAVTCLWVRGGPFCFPLCGFGLVASTRRSTVILWL